MRNLYRIVDGVDRSIARLAVVAWDGFFELWLGPDLTEEEILALRSQWEGTMGRTRVTHRYVVAKMLADFGELQTGDLVPMFECRVGNRYAYFIRNALGTEIPRDYIELGHTLTQEQAALL